MSVWLTECGCLPSLSHCHTHTETRCSTHRCSNTCWESWISLLSITSRRTAIPGCLICRVPVPPVERRHTQKPTHSSTRKHTQRPCWVAQTPLESIEREENRADMIGVVYIPPRRDEQLKLALLSTDPNDVNGSRTSETVSLDSNVNTVLRDSLSFPI